jgi:hypothetical protein
MKWKKYFINRLNEGCACGRIKPGRQKAKVKRQKRRQRGYNRYLKTQYIAPKAQEEGSQTCNVWNRKQRVLRIEDALRISWRPARAQTLNDKSPEAASTFGGFATGYLLRAALRL